jgi:hypothetical protein
VCGLKCNLAVHDIFKQEETYYVKTYGTPCDSLKWSPTEAKLIAWNSRGSSNLVTVVDTLSEASVCVVLSNDVDSIGVSFN